MYRNVFLHVYKSTMWMAGALGDQKGVLSELELKMVVNHHASAENWTGILCKSNQCSKPQSHLSSTLKMPRGRGLGFLSCLCSASRSWLWAVWKKGDAQDPTSVCLSSIHSLTSHNPRYSAQIEDLVRERMANHNLKGQLSPSHLILHQNHHYRGQIAKDS